MIWFCILNHFETGIVYHKDFKSNFNTDTSLLQGVKVSLSPGAVSEVTSLDYDILHLIWTVEKLEQQLDVIDQRCQKYELLVIICFVCTPVMSLF